MATWTIGPAAGLGPDLVVLQLGKTKVVGDPKVGDKVTMASSLEGLAVALSAQSEWAKAARLWGAAEALRQSIGAPRHAIDRPSYEQAVAEARARLGPPAFADAWTEGRAREMENGTV